MAGRRQARAHALGAVLLTPFLSLVFIHFVAGEEIRASTLAGLSLIVAGILLERWRPDRAILDRSPGPPG